VANQQAWMTTGLLAGLTLAAPALAQSTHPSNVPKSAEAKSAQADAKPAQAEAKPAQGDGGAASSAQTPSGSWPAMNDPDRWTVQISPRVWYLSPGGKIRLPGAGPSNQVKVNDLDLDQARAWPAGEIALKSGDWRFGLAAGHFGLNRETTVAAGFQLGDVTVDAGSRVRTELEWTNVQVTGGYRLYTHDFGAADANPSRHVLRLDGLLGARFTDLSVNFDRLGGPPARDSADALWIEPIAGAHLEIQIARDFSVDLEVTGGGQPFGDTTAYSLDAVVGFTWRVVDGVGVQIGWRQVVHSLKDGEGVAEFGHRGSFAGLFGGVVIRF
jgi:hypothetical protein